MVRCVNHPDREAVAKCRRCGRNFCEADLEEVGNYHYCFECLKEISRESRGAQHGQTTAMLILGVLICVGLGTFLFLGQLNNYIALINAARIGGIDALKAALTTAMILTILPMTALVLLYYALAVGLMEARGWSLAFALLLNCAVVAWKLYGFFVGQREPLLGFAVMIAVPILVVIIIVWNRHHLSV